MLREVDERSPELLPRRKTKVDEAPVDLGHQENTGPCQGDAHGQNKKKGRDERAWGRRSRPELAEHGGGSGGSAGIDASSLGAYSLEFWGQTREVVRGFI